MISAGNVDIIRDMDDLTVRTSAHCFDIGHRLVVIP